ARAIILLHGVIINAAGGATGPSRAARIGPLATIDERAVLFVPPCSRTAPRTAPHCRTQSRSSRSTVSGAQLHVREAPGVWRILAEKMVAGCHPAHPRPRKSATIQRRPS